MPEPESERSIQARLGQNLPRDVSLRACVRVPACTSDHIARQQTMPSMVLLRTFSAPADSGGGLSPAQEHRLISGTSSALPIQGYLWINHMLLVDHHINLSLFRQLVIGVNYP